ncbi:cytochrome c biogenesis protein DipZ [Shinella sp. BE166]|uniref:cytochrome c biogenesis protein DipZ n=1 Tax=Shinella sp. BE166 TaxID=3373918 RepID=UPI003EB8150B
MLLFLLAYLGGVLTIVSPCILPVLPFVFSRADRPFLKRGLPMLAGMTVTFALVASLAAVAGGWAVEANRYGRFAAIALLAVFGIMLLFPAIAERVTRPLVDFGARLSRSADGGIGGSLLLGAATGLLWAPCAGPVLGLILTGAALQGANIGTTVLLLAYAAGAATSLALAILVGGRVFSAMKRSLGAGEWVRRGLGAAVLVAVAAIALGLDTGLLTRLSLSGTVALEERLIKALDAEQPVAMSGSSGMMQADPAMMAGGSAMMAGGSAMMAANPQANATGALPVEGIVPSLAGAVEWLNSPPLTSEGLKGKVVLVDFWTYSCVNCLRAIPYVRAWAEKYKDQGLVVIGVHTPEFAFEKDLGNVRQAAADLGITYPVAIDNDYTIWRAFNNRYWPAHYFIDAEGRIRHHKFGEGGYDESERVIQKLLAEAGARQVASDIVAVNATGAQAASDTADVLSPETYIGYERAQNFVSPGGAVNDVAHAYTDGGPRLNEWGFDGSWTIGREHAALDAADGAIVYRFHARDLHLVLGPAADGKPIRFRVTLDGAPPTEDHGVDVAADGTGVITGQRLYQLVRQKDAARDRTFEIRFLDPGVEAYAFTFG